MRLFVMAASLLFCLTAARGDDVCGSAAERAAASGWFELYKSAWEHRDASAATALFAKDAEYSGDPFDAPLRGEEQIRRYWDEVASGQRTVGAVGYQLLSAQASTALVRWRAVFVRVAPGQRVELEGIAQYSLNREGKCTHFFEWWNRKPS